MKSTLFVASGNDRVVARKCDGIFAMSPLFMRRRSQSRNPAFMSTPATGLQSPTGIDPHRAAGKRSRPDEDELCNVSRVASVYAHRAADLPLNPNRESPCAAGTSALRCVQIRWRWIEAGLGGAAVSSVHTGRVAAQSRIRSAHPRRSGLRILPDRCSA